MGIAGTEDPNRSCPRERMTDGKETECHANSFGFLARQACAREGTRGTVTRGTVGLGMALGTRRGGTPHLLG